jgi:hypothetical protein
MKYRKKQKSNTTKSKSKMPQKAKMCALWMLYVRIGILSKCRFPEKELAAYEIRKWWASLKPAL